MQSRRATWTQAVRAMASLAMLASCAVPGFAASAPVKAEPPKPLPAEIVKAWEQAGATVGWARVHDLGDVAFLPATEERAGDLPAFWFQLLKEGVAAKLPAPETAFGLELGLTPGG